jgi:hypothetical protein
MRIVLDHAGSATTRNGYPDPEFDPAVPRFEH